MREVFPVRQPVGDSGLCYDARSPFKVTHYGKLKGVLGAVDGSAQKPPRSHCVVEVSGPEALAVVRFTQHQGSYSDLEAVTSDVDEAAAIHSRHLTKLAEVGLNPWLTDVQPSGKSEAATSNGLFILQDMLPDNAEPEIKDADTYFMMRSRVEAYIAWAISNNEPCILNDIERPQQYSMLEDEVFLHDVEPLYELNPFRTPS